MMNYPIDQLTGLTEKHLTSLQVGEKHFLVHKLIKDDLIGLIQNAEVNGFQFSIASSFRDFHRQALIWNNKFSGQRPLLDQYGQALNSNDLTDLEKVHAIMRWSALPGASRHHWGTDIDVYARDCLPENVQLQLEPWEYISGHQKEFNTWLTEALEQFGFYRPYQKDLGGVAIEPWHISHQHVSQDMMQQLTIDSLQLVWKEHSFLGLDVINQHIETLFNQYITNISQEKTHGF